MLPRSQRLRATLILGLSLALGAVPALAEPSKTDIAAAKKLFSEAEADEADERWGAAVEKLRRVLLIKDASGVRFHLAHCEERLGQLVAALGDYRRAAELAEMMPPGEREALRERAVARVAELEQRVPSVTIVLPGEPREVRVTLDERLLSAADLAKPLRLDPGEYVVKATAAGRKPFREKLILIERGTARVQVVLESDAPPVASSAGPAPPPPPAPPPTSSFRVPTSAYVTGGMTLVLAGVSTAYFIRKKNLQDETDATCEHYCNIEERKDRIDELRVIAIGTGVAAAAGLGVTIAIIAASQSGPKPAASLQIAPAPGGATVLGRF